MRVLIYFAILKIGYIFVGLITDFYMVNVFLHLSGYVKGVGLGLETRSYITTKTATTTCYFTVSVGTGQWQVHWNFIYFFDGSLTKFFKSYLILVILSLFRSIIFCKRHFLSISESIYFQFCHNFKCKDIT